MLVYFNICKTTDKLLLCLSVCVFSFAPSISAGYVPFYYVEDNLNESFYITDYTLNKATQKCDLPKERFVLKFQKSVCVTFKSNPGSK